MRNESYGFLRAINTSKWPFWLNALLQIWQGNWLRIALNICTWATSAVITTLLVDLLDVPLYWISNTLLFSLKRFLPSKSVFSTLSAAIPCARMPLLRYGLSSSHCFLLVEQWESVDTHVDHKRRTLSEFATDGTLVASQNYKQLSGNSSLLRITHPYSECTVLCCLKESLHVRCNLCRTVNVFIWRSVKD